MEGVMTRGQMDHVVSIGFADVDEEDRRLAQAQRVFTNATAGCPVELDTAQCATFKQALIEAHLPALQEAEQVATRAAARISRSVQAVLAQTQTAVTTLSQPDAAQASALLPLLQHEVANVALPDLVQQVRTAIANGDKARSHLYAELLPARLKEQAAVAWPGDRDKQAAMELATMLGQLRSSRRDHSYDGVRSGASSVMEKAAALRRSATARAKEAAGPGTTWDGRPMTAWPT